MITAKDFLHLAKKENFSFYTGVPCSLLNSLINCVIRDSETFYVGATNEGEAVAIAAGAWLAGRETIVLLQNSGLSNALNSLVSLNWTFHIPTLLIITWRGQPGYPAEPQHELTGQITLDLLNLTQIHNRMFPTITEDLLPALREAHVTMLEQESPFAFIMVQEMVTVHTLSNPRQTRTSSGKITNLYDISASKPTRVAALAFLLSLIPEDSVVVTTTGKCGRELFTIADRDQHFYQVGSMGAASAVGLGIALNTGHPVIIVDGDGAALMQMGNLATIGAYMPRNIVHILLDNAVYDSTGGQPTSSSTVSFVDVACACGYATATVVNKLADFKIAFQKTFSQSGPHLIHLHIKPGSMPNLHRPTIRPSDIARRLRKFITEDLLP